MWKRMHLPASPEEVQMKMLMHDIHGEQAVFIELQAVLGTV